MSTMSDLLSPAALASILIKKLEESELLGEDIAHYHRHEPGHVDHTYKFLLSWMMRAICPTQEAENRRNQTCYFNIGDEDDYNNDSHANAVPSRRRRDRDDDGPGDDEKDSGIDREDDDEADDDGGADEHGKDDGEEQ